MKYILLFILALAATSCSIFWTEERRAQKHLAKAISLDPEIVKSNATIDTLTLDSIRIKDSIRVKDSVHIIEKDSTVIRPETDLEGVVDAPCDSTGTLGKFNYWLGSGVHQVHIWSDGKKLRFNSHVDELVSEIKSKDTYIEHLRDSLSRIDSTHSQEIKVATNTVVTKIVYKPRWYHFILPSLITLIIGFLLGKIFKFKIPFLETAVSKLGSIFVRKSA